MHSLKFILRIFHSVFADHTGCGEQKLKLQIRENCCCHLAGICSNDIKVAMVDLIVDPVPCSWSNLRGKDCYMGCSALQCGYIPGSILQCGHMQWLAFWSMEVKGQMAQGTRDHLRIQFVSTQRSSRLTIPARASHWCHWWVLCSQPGRARGGQEHCWISWFFLDPDGISSRHSQGLRACVLETLNCSDI